MRGDGLGDCSPRLIPRPLLQEDFMEPTRRFDILRRDGFTCRYCGRHAPAVVIEVDHIDPKANGGLDTEDNLVAACFSCNRGKRDKRGVLPPPTITDPVPYPVGMFFNIHRDPDEPRPEWMIGRMHGISEQGFVMAVQDDDVWCTTYDLEGEPSFIRALPRNNWRQWEFYTQARDMRYWYLYESYRVGFVPWEDIERFEEHEAIRFNDKVSLRAFYVSHPEYDPEKPESHWPAGM